jgi:hypothetical protein
VRLAVQGPENLCLHGPQTVCDHHLKGNCTDYANTHHFGGMENYNNPDVVIPGSGGDPTGGDGGDRDRSAAAWVPSS